MRVGIAGFAGVGKSTVFELLTGVTPETHGGLKGQLGVARLPDPRLDYLAEVFEPDKIRPIAIELVDLPALVGEEHSENARRLDLVREADGIVVVLGAFLGTDPAKELAAFRDEALLADLQVVTNRLERIAKTLSKARPDWQNLEHEQALLERVRDVLEAGKPTTDVERTPEEDKRITGFRFLTAKPMMAVVNVAEDHRDQHPPDGLGVPAESVCARLELELAQLDEDERAMFMDDMGVAALSRDRLLVAIHTAMGQISFFTGEGGKELAAWSLPAGADAVTAAGKIHTDIARGFIRAEVINFETLKPLGDMKTARGQGQVRTEGREAVIHDGDIILFRFSV